jgi:hypothetical protein
MYSLNFDSYIDALLLRLPSLTRQKQRQELRTLIEMGAEIFVREFQSYQADIALRARVREMTK